MSFYRIIMAGLFPALWTGIPAETRQEYRDAFYFTPVKPGPNLYLQFEWRRSASGSPADSSTFIGRVFWQGRWFDLEPRNYPAVPNDPELFPPHPSFDFSWPQKGEAGVFHYHFPRFMLKVVFTPFEPLHTAEKSKRRLSEFSLAQARLSGTSVQMEGLLLYHRFRATTPTKDSIALQPIFQHMAVFTARDKRTFFGLQPAETGSPALVLTLGKPMPLIRDTLSTWFPDKADTLELPVAREKWTLNKHYKSPVRGHHQLHTLSGTLYMGPRREAMRGLLVSWRPEAESNGEQETSNQGPASENSLDTDSDFEKDPESESDDGFGENAFGGDWDEDF